VFTADEAREVAKTLDVDFEAGGFALEDLVKGMEVELEHGTRFPDLDVTGNDLVTTAKIALAHLREFPDYYDRLARMENEAEEARAEKPRS